jgi:predicted PurR-regulated permease PerM
MLKSIQKLPRWLQLGLTFPLAFLNGWLLFQVIQSIEPLFSIFVAASLLAFLLDLPIRLLEQRGISRGWATVLVFFAALLILSLFALILIPLIVQQLSEFITILPKWLESGSQQLQNLQQWAIAQRLSVDIRGLLTQTAEKISNLLQSFSSQLLNFVLSTIGSIVNIIIVLVLTVFLTLTGESVWQGIFSWFPPPWNRQSPEDIRQTFESYFASQAILAGILSAAQTVVFLVLQVPYAVLFGVTIGMTTLIPYASAFTIVVVSLLLMLKDFWLGTKVLITAIIVGQINDNVVAPRLMGGMTGLNPVWIIISLFIGSKVLGILGLLIAVPIASVIKTTADSLRSRITDSRELMLVEAAVPVPEEKHGS